MEKFESLNQEWTLAYDDNVLKNWSAEESAKLMISGTEVAELYGLNNFGCVDDEDDHYPKIKADMQFVSRVLVNSKDMYLLLEKIANGSDTPWHQEAKEMIARIGNSEDIKPV